MPNQQLPITVFDSPADVEKAALDLVRSILARGSEDEPAHIVLAGGSTPRNLYERLAQVEDVPWDNVHVWFGDERTVPPDHEDSNYGMAHEHLLSRIDIPAENIHRVRGEDDPARAARDYSAEIGEYVELRPSGMPKFDLVILGLGEDGHTASLFPDTEALDATMEVVVANEVPQEDTTRITLTNPALNAAEHVLFLATGESKAEPLAAIVEGGDDAPPAAFVRPVPGELHWYVDRAAAGRLRGDQVST